jgi:hypothetical protein
MRTGFVFRGILPSLALVAGLLGSVRAEDPPPTETVQILEARAAGLLDVTVRGQGTDKVKFLLKNTSERRLNVVFPPGLVAAAGAGQAGGFQSMGLGLPTDRAGSFGRFRFSTSAGEGFRSVPANAERSDLALSPGQASELLVPGVCLNFGLPDPTPLNEFTLMDVSDYTSDVRVQRALRSLGVLGTSQPVAQAIMWNVANDMTFSQMSAEASKYVIGHDLAAAARFVEALDGSSATGVVDPAYFQDGRIMLLLRGEGSAEKVVARLNRELEGARLLGLPIQVVSELPTNAIRPATTVITVDLAAGPNGSTVARASVRHRSAFGDWIRIGEFGARDDHELPNIEAANLTEILDRGLARSFVRIEPIRRGNGSTTFRVTNRLPLSLVNLDVQAGRANDAPRVTLEGLGVGPMRSSVVSLPAANAAPLAATLNGL